jgi:hypothetical protein
MLIDKMKEKIAPFGYQYHKATDVISFMLNCDEGANKSKVVVLLYVETKPHLVSTRILAEMAYKAYEDLPKNFSGKTDVMVVLLHSGMKNPFHPNRKNFISLSTQSSCEVVVTAMDECFIEISKAVTEN